MSAIIPKLTLHIPEAHKYQFFADKSSKTYDLTRQDYLQMDDAKINQISQKTLKTVYRIANIIKKFIELKNVESMPKLFVPIEKIYIKNRITEQQNNLLKMKQFELKQKHKIENFHLLQRKQQIKLEVEIEYNKRVEKLKNLGQNKIQDYVEIILTKA